MDRTTNITEQEKLDIFRAFVQQIADDAKQAHPLPGCSKPPVGMHPSNSLVYFSPAMQDFIAELGKDDIERLELVTKINPAVLESLSRMSEKEWDKFVKTADFLASSSNAIKITSIVAGACVSTLLALFGLAKAGYDFFAAFRSLPK